MAFVWILLVSGLFVGAMLGFCGLGGVSFGELSSSELSVLVGLFAYPPLVVGFSIWWWTRTDAAVERALSGLALQVETWRIAGSVGGTFVVVEGGSFEGPTGERRPAWILTLPIETKPAITIVTVGEEVSEEASQLTETHPSALAPASASGAPVRVHTAASDASDDGSEAAWIDASLAASMLEILDLMQVRVGPAGVRVIVARPPEDPVSIRRAIVLAVSVASIFSPAIAARSAALASLPPAPEVPRRKVSRAPLRPRAWTKFFPIGTASLSMAIALLVVPDCQGYEPQILRMVGDCKLAREAIGDPVKRKQLGWQPGTAENRWNYSHVLVEGDRGEGDVTIRTYRRKKSTPVEERPFIEVVLETHGREIDILTCSENAFRGLSGTFILRGTASEITGTAPVQKGATCTLTGNPNEDVFPCRFEVQCAGQTIYGATPTTGFNVCSEVDLGGRRAPVAWDVDLRLPDSEPTLDLDPRRGNAILSDRQGAWSITIALDQN